MRRKTLHLAIDFFLIGAAVPLVLLVLWRFLFEHRAVMQTQSAFLKIALLLWPTGIQIIVVPHGQGDLGYALAIAVMVIQNAILYSVIALCIHWLVCRVRRHDVPQPR